MRPTATFARETRQQLDMYENGKTMAAAVSVDAVQYIFRRRFKRGSASFDADCELLLRLWTSGSHKCGALEIA